MDGLVLRNGITQAVETLRKLSAIAEERLVAEADARIAFEIVYDDAFLRAEGPQEQRKSIARSTAMKERRQHLVREAEVDALKLKARLTESELSGMQTVYKAEIAQLV